MAQPVRPPVRIGEDDVNLPSTGLPNKEEPTALLQGQGYERFEEVFAEHFNYVMNNHGEWLQYLAAEDSNFNIVGGTGIDVNESLGVYTITVDPTVVNTTDAQTIGGLKSFSIVPRTTAAQDLANNALVKIEHLNTELAGKVNVGDSVGTATNADKWTNLMTLTVDGQATGSVQFDGSSPATLTLSGINASTAAALATPFTLTLNGDVSGSAPIDGSAPVTIPVTVDPAQHIHEIAQVNGLQTALDTKIEADDYATPLIGGTLKARLSGDILYLSNDGSNP